MNFQIIEGRNIAELNENIQTLIDTEEGWAPLYPHVITEIQFNKNNPIVTYQYSIGMVKNWNGELNK